MDELADRIVGRFVALANSGANPAQGDGGSIRQEVDRQLSDILKGNNTQNCPGMWTEFVALYASVLGEIPGMHPLLIATLITLLIYNGLTSVAALMDVDDELLGRLRLPARVAQLLPALKAKLMSLNAQESLLRDENIDSNSRLWVERKRTVEGEITKIEYKTLTGMMVVWEMAVNRHNLPVADELQESARISQDTLIAPATFPEEVRKQFHVGLLERLIERINSLDEAADLAYIYSLSGIGDNRGEMIFQQAVFPPLSLAILAAASRDREDTGKRYTYIADQDAISSSFVCYDSQEYAVCGKPDAAILMPGSNDLIAMMELKPEDNLNHQDVAKCILWSSIAGQALVRAGVPRDQVRIPFLIGSGFHASLFVTEILGGPVDADSFCPRVSCMFDHLTLQSLENRKKIFVTLVLLLGRMKMSIGNLSNDSLPTLRGRRKLRQQVSRNILSKRIKSNKLSSAGALSTGQAEEQANSRGDRRDESENMAMEAVMKFCPETTHLVYPWPRYRSIFGGDESQFYQQSSPFHFRGKCLGSDVFYKVWRQGDDCVDELWVEREVSLLRHALTCGVSVPSVLRFGRLQASNHVFLALQLEDLGDLHFAHRRDELMIYARSLINNVSKLHSKAKILHCDLKPENVVWNGTNVLLLDFGRAQRIGEVVPVPGTSGFEAPEVEQGLANTCSTDAFSVGKLLLAAINRFERKDKAVQYLQSIGEGLCVPERQHRLSLKDADSKLKEFERRHMRPSHKKAKIVEKERGLGVKTLSLIT